MIAVFYDRKNNRNVRSDQLGWTKVVETSLVVDAEERTHGEWQGRKKEKAFLNEKLLANLCYKSPNCPASQNWDMCTSIEHLVFLNLVRK